MVAHFGDAVLVADARIGLDTFTRPVVEELERAAGVLTPELAWNIAGRVASAPAAAPAFGVAFATDGGFRLLLHGAVRAVVDGLDRARGSAAATWVDVLVDAPARQLTLTLADRGDVAPDAHCDLRLGTVSGSGAAVVFATTAAGAVTPTRTVPAHAAPEPEAEPEPEAATEATAEPEPAPPVMAPAPVPPDAATPPLPEVMAPSFTKPEAQPALQPEAQPQPQPEPLPELQRETQPQPQPEPQPEPEPVPEPAPEPPAEPAVVIAHEPRPTDELPPVTAAAPQAPARETIALRDSLTALMSDDGVRTPLDRPYVFGREPQLDPAVAEGHASPIRLADPEQLISRVQAYVYVAGARVTVQDAHSANGTFIAAPGAPDWQRLGDDPVELPVGWSIRMGRRIFTHFGVG
jgi:pSer/pThr/pTyr-binding forkhead associated (FHA) protein